MQDIFIGLFTLGAVLLVLYRDIFLKSNPNNVIATVALIVSYLSIIKIGALRSSISIILFSFAIILLLANRILLMFNTKNKA